MHVKTLYFPNFSFAFHENCSLVNVTTISTPPQRCRFGSAVGENKYRVTEENTQKTVAFFRGKSASLSLCRETTIRRSRKAGGLAG